MGAAKLAGAEVVAAGAELLTEPNVHVNHGGLCCAASDGAAICMALLVKVVKLGVDCLSAAWPLLLAAEG